ncbi:hypothetical protein GCM10027277_44440 [Pseudoduganella ginsengisoli]|uniref:DUF2799 domain-containing protein n=1 Tax=Pseudoduganella ginsengisoli TaxID=1462440 RepID=A0A6L6Q2Q1_9BURK|nr:DUF2799 domain-containing protein [Pseudoduganella ginsengisoli]MTW03756.1 DUF2799 domain-containing protein [Pseudoduganella ginsengisoli]
MMTNLLKLIPVLAVTGALLSGCETMSKSECATANWSDVGLRDGMGGKAMSVLDDRVSDCSKAGVKVDMQRYMAGREQGLRDFCRLEKAAPLGLSGTSYSGVCPPQIDLEFRRRHQIGYNVYQMRSRVNDLNSRSERLQHRLREADRDEEKQVKAADKEDDRKRIRREFDDKRRNLRNELRDVDRDIQRARDNLRDAEYVLDSMR